jgi:hypothetical protein
MSTGDFIGDASQFQTPATKPQLNYDLRPLTTGEVLDRTFQIYRSRFALFAGLAMLPAGVNVVTNALKLMYAAHQDTHAHVGSAFYTAQIIMVTLSAVAALISLVLYGITQAATTWALSAVYLGEAASMKAAYRVAFKHWFRYTVIMLRQVWAGIWLPTVLFVAAIAIAAVGRRHGTSMLLFTIPLFVLAFLSIVYGVWAYIRVSLAVPAAVVESLKSRASLRRSAQLLASRKVRIFLLFLLLFALYLVVGAIESPLLLLAVRARGTQAFITQAINLAVSFAAGTLIGPVGAIAVCLFYFDERVRREGFDIEWMMRKLAPATTGGTGTAGPTQGNSAEPI